MATTHPTYSKRPEVVEAFVYDGTNQQEVIDFTEGAAKVVDGVFYLEHPGGDLQPIEETNWITRDPWYNFWCMIDENFQVNYQPTSAVMTRAEKPKKVPAPVIYASFGAQGIVRRLPLDPA